MKFKKIDEDTKITLEIGDLRTLLLETAKFGDGDWYPSIDELVWIAKYLSDNPRHHGGK